MRKATLFLFKTHMWCTQSETHKKKLLCTQITISPHLQHAQKYRAMSKGIMQIQWSWVLRDQATAQRTFPFHPNKPKVLPFFTGWRKQTPLPCQVAEGRDDDHSSCRCSQYEKEYDPRSDQNERDRRSVHPVSHCAARLESPFREALGE